MVNCDWAWPIQREMWRSAVIGVVKARIVSGRVTDGDNKRKRTTISD
jgi:hypothetical protein